MPPNHNINLLPLIRNRCFAKHSLAIQYVVFALSLVNESYVQIYSRVGKRVRKADWRLSCARGGLWGNDEEPYVL